MVFDPGRITGKTGSYPLKPGGVLVAITQPPSEEQASKHDIKASMLVTEVSSASLRKVVELADAGEIKSTVGKIYPLSDVAKARRESRSNQIEGKIVFKVAADAEQEPELGKRTASGA